MCKKQKDGAWQSKGVYCSHVTAGVLCDLYGYNLNDDVMKSAINYILSCYNYEDGYFYSYPSDKSSPQIYVTYICLKSLILYRNIENIDLDKIKVWIEKSCNWDGKWGISSCNGFSTLTHTIYALRILAMCGLTKTELTSKYKSQINWLKKTVVTLHGKYDSEEIIKPDSIDSDGITYSEVTIQHSCIAEIGMFWLDYKDLIYSTSIAKEILLDQYNGGWGMAYNRLTMWETGISLKFLTEYKTRYLESSYIMKLLCNITFHFSLKTISTLFGVVIIIISFFWIMKQQARIDGLIISLMASVLLSIIGNIAENNK